MSLQEIYYVAEMVVGAAVIISIVFVAMELRQNTYITRSSLAAARAQQINWLMETFVTDENFRDFYYKIEFEKAFEELNKKERARAVGVGIRFVRPMLNELLAYHDGQISPDEFHSLEVNIKQSKNCAFMNAVYEFVKTAYPKKVQDHWKKLRPIDNYQPSL